MSSAKSVTYNLPGLSFPVENSYVIDLSGQPAITGREIAGILGYDFFARYVVEINYEAAILTLRSPNAFQYSGNGEAVPFDLEKNTPHIRARIAVAGQPQQERKLLVDSGSEDAVDDDLLAQSPQRLEVIGGVGLGKEFRTILGRADSLQIGRFVLQHPFGAAGGVPLVGTEVLRRFNVLFDYAHGRMILERNTHFGDPFVMDASGLDLRWSREGFVVHDVSSDSIISSRLIPAFLPDVAIDHQPASAFTLEQVGKLMTQEGHTVLLTIRRGKSTSDILLALRARL